MIRNLKALGLALVTVFAMSALGTSAASAAEFHSSAEVTELVGNQVGEHVFVTNTGVIACAVVHFTGIQKGATSETMVLAPSYTECEFEELFNVTVSINGCKYVSRVSSETEGTVDIAGCNESVPYIQVGSLATCRTRVSEQSEKGPVGYENHVTSVTIVRITTHTTAAISGLQYTESGLFCAGGAVNNGTYVGTTEIEGNGGEADIYVG